MQCNPAVILHGLSFKPHDTRLPHVIYRPADPFAVPPILSHDVQGSGSFRNPPRDMNVHRHWREKDGADIVLKPSVCEQGYKALGQPS